MDLLPWLQIGWMLCGCFWWMIGWSSEVHWWVHWLVRRHCFCLVLGGRRTDAHARMVMSQIKIIFYHLIVILVYDDVVPTDESSGSGVTIY